MYNNNYAYWTMSSYNDSIFNAWVVSTDGTLKEFSVNTRGYDSFPVVRPVITISKTSISS